MVVHHKVHNPSFKKALMSTDGEDLFFDTSMGSDNEVEDEKDNGSDSDNVFSKTEGLSVDDFQFDTIDGVSSIKISDRKQAELARRWHKIDCNAPFRAPYF